MVLEIHFRGSPHQGNFGTWRSKAEQGDLTFWSLIPQRVRPFGGGGVHRSGKEVDEALIWVIHPHHVLPRKTVKSKKL